MIWELIGGLKKKKPAADWIQDVRVKCGDQLWLTGGTKNENTREVESWVWIYTQVKNEKKCELLV